MRLLLPQILVVFLVLFSGADAWAHPGHFHPVDEVDEFDDEAFMSAARHPFMGWDHLLTMLIVGGVMLVAAATVGRRRPVPAAVRFAGASELIIGLLLTVARIPL